MSEVKPPPKWGQDEITKFINDTTNNTYATFHNMKPVFQRLVDIDNVFRSAIDCLYNTREWFEALFLLRAHSAYLGAVRLAASTQLVESYMVLRGCLENALYGHYIYYKKTKEPSSNISELWLRRQDDDSWREKFRKIFTYGKVIKAIIDADPATGRVSSKLYERAIDYGAHPNPYGILTNVEIIKDSKTKKITFNTLFLNETPIPFRLCLKTTAQVGSCSLAIFNNVFKARFKIAGVDDLIARVKRGL